jgi:pimeloyl-ACP methyl ester carboxylesterase
VRGRVRDHWITQAAGYRAPVLAIWGRDDAVLPIHHLAGAKDVFPQAEVRIIERCGHLPMIERTEEFLAAMLPFLDRSEQATASPAASGVAPLTANA